MLAARLRSPWRGCALRETGGATLLFASVLLILVGATAGVMLHFLLANRLIVASRLDREIAFRAAEAALLDAESELLAAARSGEGAARLATWPLPGQCGSGDQAGICRTGGSAVPVWQPWLSPDRSPEAVGVPLGAFSGATLPELPPGAAGATSLPRYVVELLDDVAAGTVAEPHRPRLRITAIGFGRGPDTRAVLQTEVQP